MIPKISNGFPIAEVGLDDRVMDDGETASVLNRHTGFAELSPKTVRDLARLGVYARGVGALRTQRGRVLVSQEWLAHVTQKLVKEFDDETSRSGPAKEIRSTLVRGYAHDIVACIQAMMTCVSTSLELEKAAAPTGKPDDVERPRNTSFGTGTVIAAQEVHVHQDKKELPANGNGG